MLGSETQLGNQILNEKLSRQILKKKFNVSVF